MSLNPRPNQHDIFNQANISDSHKRTSLDTPALDLGNIPTPPPTQNQSLAQNTQNLPQMPITPPINTQADSKTPPASAEGDTGGGYPNATPAQKEIFANDVSDEPKPYPTSKMRKLSLNAQVINAINAKNADEALDFLSTQESNIDWEQVAQARANGVKSHEILSQIANTTATNPRAMWINIDTPLSKGELARAKFDYERSQISDDELKNLKEQTSLNQFKSLNFWLGLDDEKKRQANLTLAKFAESTHSYEDLPQEAKSLLNVQGKDSYTLNVRSIFSGKSEGELLYEQKQKQAKIYQKIKNKEQLSDDELDYIDSYGEGAGFGDNAEKQKQWLLKYEAQNIIPSYTQSMVFALENKADYKALFFGSGKGKERDKEKFLQGLEGIAKVSGFDSASVDEKSGDIFFEKEGFAYQVNTRFLDNIDNMLKANAFSMGGSIAGSIAGAKAVGKNPASLITGVVGGGALGAFVGGTLDGVLADLYTNNQINFSENLRHGLHEGIFNIAGDAIVGGVIKGGKVLAKAAKNFTPQGLKDTLTSSAQRAKNLTNKIMEYSIVGQAAKNVFDGNASAVRSFLAQIPKDERESIKQGIKDFGLELELNPKSNQALNNFISKHGQSHPHLANTAQKVYDIFTLPAGKELQQELLSSIRADNTGALLGFLSEAANSSPALQKSLHSILNQTHARAINHLKSFGLKQNDIAQVFEAYQKGTKEAYAKALDMIQEVFKSEKTQVSRKQYDSLVSELKASALDEKELNYLKTLESKIYGNGENGSPRSFENLKDALSLLNEKWGKHAKNMNFTAEKLRRVEKQMREDIKQGINAIFDSSSQGASFRELFESALSDYGNMKGILKAVDKLKLRDTSIAYQKTLDKMLDFLIAGEKGEFSNLEKLTAHLPKEQKIKFELATLNALLEKSIFSAKNGQEKVLEVFNSGEFLARLESIAGEFSTPQAREYIDFVKEFHNLFKNDYAISKATLEPALTQKMGGGIATTPTGRFEYQRAKLIYDSIIRLMPHIPFMSNFNEKISGAAVRYHLKSALRKSHSVSELKRTLNAKLASGKFDSPTSKIIAQMLDGVESSQEQIIKELNGGSDIGGNTQNPHTAQVDSTQLAQADSKIPSSADGHANNPPPSAEGDKGGGYDFLASQAIQEATPKQALETLSHTPATQMPEKITINEFMQSLDEVGNKANFIEHLLSKGDAEQRIAMLNLVEPTLKSPDIVAQVVENGAKKQKHIKKFSDGKEFFYLLASKENGSVLLTGFKTNRLNTIEKELENADIIQTFIRQGSKQEPNSRFGLPNEKIIAQSNTNVQNTTKNNEIKQNIFTLAKQEKQAKEQEKLAKKQADSEFIAQREAQKQARLDKLLAAQRDSQGSTTLEARAKIKAEQMGEDIPYTRLSDTHIILDDITYPAEFVMIDKKDLKPSFEAGGFQTREVKQEGKIAQIRDNFDPLKIFGKVGEYDGLPLIARNGEIIAGNHRGEAIKNLSGENLARYNEYAKKVFGIDLPQDKIIVRRILDDTEASNGANLLEQIALAARSNKGAESTLGEQATSALGTYKDKIQKELLDNPARRYIESDSVDNQMQAVANLLNAPLKAEEANLALLASLSKASHNLDIAKALDMIEGDDLLKAKIKNMLIANAGGFYNISRSIATPKLNEITNYLVDGIAYLGKASKQSGAENINRSEAYRELASKINDRASGKVRSFTGMETPLDEFVAQAKADVLGASLSKFANQDHASQRLYEALRDMPSILEEKFSTPSFDFFGNGGNKALKEVDIYDFLDYMIGRGQQNEATSQLKDALLELKKLESSTPNPPSPNNTPPNTNNTPPTNKLESNTQNNPSSTGNATPPSKPNPNTTLTSSTDNAGQVANNADNTITPPASTDGHANNPPSSAQADNAITPPPTAEGDTGGGLFDLPKQADFSNIKDKEQLQNIAQNLTFEKFAPLPQKVSLDEFLQESHTFDNVENFIKHLQTRQDAKAREAYLNLIEPTKQNPDLIINTGNKQEFIKAFEYERKGKKEIFNIVATQENGKIVLSALPTKKIDYIKNKIKNADSIEVKQGAIKDFTTPLENQSLTHEEIIPSSTTKEAQNQTPKSFINFYENLPSSIKSNADKKDLQVSYEFLNGFDFENVKGTQNAKLANKINKLIRKNPPASISSQKTNELYNLDRYIDFIDNPQVIKSYATDNLYENLTRAGFFVPKDSAKQKNFAKNVLKIPQVFDSINTKDNALIRVLKKRAHFDGFYSDKDTLSVLYVDEARLAKMRNGIEQELDLHPLSEFGTNYAEFYQDGKGAIAKLISEANAAKEAGQDFSGQVAGAFSKDIDGAEASIDLVWGKITNAQTHEGYGLAHIIDKHPELDLNLIPQIIEKGKIVENAGTKTIIYKTDSSELRVGLSKGFFGKGDNEWIITAYEKATPAQNFDQVASKVQSGNNLPTSGDNQIIQKISQKFNKDENFAKNLYEWHKDSHPITKEADGTPKVFYHATNADKKFEIFDKSKIHSGYGFWFGDDIKSQAVQEAKTSNIPIYKVFLKIKKPFEVLEPINKNNYKEFEKIFDKNFEKELKNNEKIAEFESFVKQELNIDEVDIGVVNFIWSVRKDGKWKDYRGNELNKILTPKIEKEAQKYLDDGIIRKIYFNYLPRAYAGEAQEVKQIKQRLINNGYDGIKYGDEYVVFDSNQIKAVGNKGTFEATNPNIYHSSSTAGGGVLGGTIAGVERDEEGNIIGFSPQNFALGFASGAAGAKALSKIAHSKTAQNLANKANQNLANSKAITLSQKSIQKLATNPRAKAVLDKIKSKNDIIASQKITKGQTNMQNPHIKILRDNLKQALSPILNTDIINKNTGIVARLSTNGLNKISSSMAVKKSIENGFSRAEHFAVASDLKNLFENATLLKTHDDYKKKPNIKAIHRYIAQTKINDKDAQALITLKESIQNGHRIYSMELEEVKPL